MFFRMPRILLAGRERPEVLALKHESRILGQWTNPVSGSKGRTKPVLQTAQILSPVPSWRNHMECWMNVRESYSRALEQDTLVAARARAPFLYGSRKVSLAAPSNMIQQHLFHLSCMCQSLRPLLVVYTRRNRGDVEIPLLLCFASVAWFSHGRN